MRAAIALLALLSACELPADPGPSSFGPRGGRHDIRPQPSADGMGISLGRSELTCCPLDVKTGRLVCTGMNEEGCLDCRGLVAFWSCCNGKIGGCGVR